MFFSVILPINEAFKEKRSNDNNKKINKIRKNKDEIEKAILETLNNNDLSAKKLYEKLGYSGNVSKTFRECINDLIKKKKINIHLN